MTATAFAAVRAAQYGAIAIALGALALLLLAWAPARRALGGPAWAAADAAFARGLRRLLVAVSAAGLLSALAGLVLQGATAGGTSAWAALDADVLDAVLSTRFGESGARERSRGRPR